MRSWGPTGSEENFKESMRISLLKIISIWGKPQLLNKDHLERRGQTDQRMLQKVPPGLYDEVQKYLQEMTDIGAIWPSNSPWASAIVLVRKKNGKICFCIDLMKLNSLMVKDAYSIPRIQGTLDCLQGSYSLHYMPPWVLWVWLDAIQADECSSNVSASYGDMFG